MFLANSDNPRKAGRPESLRSLAEPALDLQLRFGLIWFGLMLPVHYVKLPHKPLHD